MYIYYLLYGDPGNNTLHLPNYEYALSDPNQSLGAGGINPQAGCSEEEKKENGGHCPVGPTGSAEGAANYANQFLHGPIKP
jgi:hypothetical protein